MKLPALILLFSILFMSTSVQIQASQYLYDTLIAYPKQCLQQNCSSEVIALQNNPQFQACKPICQYNATCWQSCGQQIPNQILLNLGSCIEENECYNEIFIEYASAALIENPYWIMFCLDISCITAQLKAQQSILGYQSCSNDCGRDQLCLLDCPRSAAIQNAIYLAQCYLQYGNPPSNFYQPLYNPNCVYYNCPSQCEAINNNPEQAELAMCLNQCLADKSCWASCIPENQQQNLNQCVQCAQQNNCKQNYYF